MPHAYLRFYAELSRFLPPMLRLGTLRCSFRAGASVREVIEALGVPLSDVDLVLANGVSVDGSYLLCPGDRVSVYPAFETIDISSVVRLRPKPLRLMRAVN